MNARTRWVVLTAPLLAMCASTARKAPPSEEELIDRARQIVAGREYRPLTALVPEPIIAFLDAHGAGDLSRDDLERAAEVLRSEEAGIEDALLVASSVFAYERSREDSPSPRLEAGLYRLVESVAETASSSLVQQMVAIAEFPDELREPMAELIAESESIAARARDNQLAALEKLLDTELDRRHLGTLAYVVSELGDCELGSALWERAATRPGDSPSEASIEEQRALFRYARLDVEPDETLPADSDAHHGLRFARKALAAPDTEERSYYQGAALKEASCLVEAETVWSSLTRPELRAFARAQADPLGAPEVVEALDRIDRDALSPELRSELARHRLNRIANNWADWFDLAERPLELKRVLRSKTRQLLDDSRDYGEMSPDSVALFAALVRVLDEGGERFDGPATLALAQPEFANLREKFPKSELIWEGVFAVAAYGLTIEQPHEGLFDYLIAGTRPEDSKLLYDFATVLARLQPERAYEQISKWPEPHSPPLDAFHYALGILTSNGAGTWTEATNKFRAVERSDNANDTIVSAVLADQCALAAEVVSAGGDTNEMFRYNAVAALAVCGGEPDTIAELIEVVSEDFVEEWPKLAGELERWRSWALMKAGRIDEAKELACGLEHDPNILATDEALLAFDGVLQAGLGVSAGAPEFKINTESTPYLVLRAPADALPTCP